MVVAQVCTHKAHLGVPSRSLVKYGRLIAQHTGAGWPDLNALDTTPLPPPLPTLLVHLLSNVPNPV